MFKTKTPKFTNAKNLANASPVTQLDITGSGYLYAINCSNTSTSTIIGLYLDGVQLIGTAPTTLGYVSGDSVCLFRFKNSLKIDAQSGFNVIVSYLLD